MSHDKKRHDQQQGKSNQPGGQDKQRHEQDQQRHQQSEKGPWNNPKATQRPTDSRGTQNNPNSPK